MVAMCPYYCTMALGWLTPQQAQHVAEAIVEFWNNLKPFVTLVDLVMDVLFTEDGRVLLIEFNPSFTSGGALFNWNTDASLLAGKEEAIVMRMIHD